MLPQAWFTAGEAFIRAVQAHGNPIWDGLFGLASFLGEEYFYLLFLPFIYWCVDKVLGRWVAYALLTSAYVNSALKYTWRSPRPPETLWRNVVARPTSPGFPSGHAQTSTVVWGTLAYQGKRRWLWGLALLLIGLISFSRIYNGVHYPHDVIGGLVVGVLLLLLVNGLGPWVANWVSRRSTGSVMLVLTGVVVVLALVHPPSDRWPAEGAVTVLATLWGSSLGFLLEARYVHFRTDGPWQQRALRFAVGTVVVAVVYVGLRLLQPQPMSPLATLGWRGGRYALTGLSMTWGAPWLFIRLGLAGTDGALE